MKRILIIGAGQLGSRHLQALRGLKIDYEILVVDPSEASLQLAKERYEQIPGAQVPIQFLSVLPKLNDLTIDLAIIATNSNVRFAALSSLLSATKVANIILEKILFSDPKHYKEVLSLVEKTKSKVWVNCCMRQIQTYRQIRDLLANSGPVHCHVVASRYGLLTNLIHYVDYMNFVLNLTCFSVDPSKLDKEMYASKRAGFSECSGQLRVNYQEGSSATLTSFSSGELPIVVEISSAKERFIVREMENKVWHCGQSTKYQWVELEGVITPQSKLTTELAEDLFSSGKCFLTSLEESVATHLALYEPIRQFYKLEHYQWT